MYAYTFGSNENSVKCPYYFYCQFYIITTIIEILHLFPKTEYENKCNQILLFNWLRGKRNEFVKQRCFQIVQCYCRKQVGNIVSHLTYLPWK